MRFLPYRPLPFWGLVAGQMEQMSRVGSLANPLVGGSFASVRGKIGSPKNKLPHPAPANPLTDPQLESPAAVRFRGSDAPCLGSVSAIVPELGCFLDA